MPIVPHTNHSESKAISRGAANAQKAQPQDLQQTEILPAFLPQHLATPPPPPKKKIKGTRIVGGK